jgi:hypothetical protein
MMHILRWLKAWLEVFKPSPEWLCILWDHKWGPWEWKLRWHEWERHCPRCDSHRFALVPPKNEPVIEP